MSKYKKIWGFFFSIFFLWLALRKISFQELPKAILQINPIFFVLLLFSFTLEMITRAFRWQIIQPKEKVTFRYSLFGLILTYFFNNILPARAGELARPFYFSKKGIADSSETLGAVILERFFDGVMVILLILVSFQNFTGNDLLRKTSIVVTVFYAAILIFILLAVFKRQTFEKITKKIIGLFPKKLENLLNNILLKFIDGLSSVKDFKRLTNIFLSSILCWLSSILTLWLCFKGFGFNENFLQASFVLTVLSISSMIPASPGTIGVYEYFCIFTLCDIMNHPRDISAAFSIIMHAVQYFYILIAGFIITVIDGIKISDYKSNQKQN